MAPIGKKSTPKAPAAPDYAGAATAQGQANIDAARTGAELTNTNQYTPYGNQVFTKDPSSDQWSSTVSLSPEQQRLYELQTQGDMALGETAVQQLGRVRESMGQPLNLSGAPDRVNSVGNSNYSMYGGGTPQYARANGDILQNQDFGQQAQEVEDSLYRSASARLDPQFKQREEAERSRLLNSGVAEGSEQFTNSMDAFNRDRTAAYGDARDRSIQARGAEMSRANADLYASNAQRFGQQMASTDFNNSASQQEFNDQIRALGFNNQTEAQRFADSIAGGNFQNAARGAAIDEAAYLRNAPLNDYNALASGSQVTNPQFRGTGQVAGPNAAPTFAATQAADQRAIDLYNAQLASSGSAQGGLFGAMGQLGGAAITRWSDRRLKTNVERVGTLTGDNLPVYQYEIFGETQIGVMADEVRSVRPEAVARQANGYDMVDYGQLRGTFEATV